MRALIVDYGSVPLQMIATSAPPLTARPPMRLPFGEIAHAVPPSVLSPVPWRVIMLAASYGGRNTAETNRLEDAAQRLARIRF